MRQLLGVAAVTLIGSVLATPLQAQKESELREVEQVIATFVEKDPDMQGWFDTAYGYVVFPNVGKGGLGIGGAHGNGLAYKGGLMYEASVGGQKFDYEPFDE